jgi:hypothetical protein
MKYGKRPTVKRFRLQETRPGRWIRKAILERKENKRPKRKVRRGRTMRPTRKR